MALRKMALLGGALSLLVSQVAMAVGLGNIKLNSSLNEPLDAEIQLLNVGELSDTEILVGLAGRLDFERAGVEREYFLTSLQFTVDRSSGQPVIRVRSSKPVREPYLDFLVELQWPAGRMLREYTLLVDLPVYANNGRGDKETTGKKSQPKSVDAASSTSTARRSSSGRRSTQSSGSAALSGSEYSVKNGDTLWQIARDAKPEGASVYQSMVAIKHLNPSAFIDGNINLLKRGAVLRLPDRDQVTATTHRQAVSEVATASQPVASDRGALLDASEDTASGQPPEATPEGRLKLSVTEDNSVAGSASALESGDGNGGGSSVAGRESLENELAIAEEEVEKKDRIIEDQEDRIASLEEQLNTMQRMLEIRDSELAGVQASGSEQEQSDSTSESNPLAESDGDDTAAEDEVAGLSTQSQAPAPVAKPGFWDSYKYYVIGGVSLLVVLLFFVARRNRYEYLDDDEGEMVDLDGHIEPVMDNPAFASVSSQQAAELNDVDLAEEDQLFTAMEDDSSRLQGDRDLEQAASQDDVEDSDAPDTVGEDFTDGDLLPTSESDQITEGTDADTDSEFDLELDLDSSVAESEEQSSSGQSAEGGDTQVAEDADDGDLELDFLKSANDGVDSELEAVEVVTDSGEMPSLEAAPDSGDEDEFDLLSDGDEVGTKLDLAQAYIDMGDKDGAREILQEVIEDGDAGQQEQAQKLITDIT